MHPKPGSLLHPYFNPRSRTGSDHAANRCRNRNRNFNPRSRTGSDCDRGFRPWSSCISTHAPAQGATRSWPASWPGRSYFNPRSRTGSDYPSYSSWSINPSRISTHAPAQGATFFRCHIAMAPVFQPTLPHRERHPPHSRRCIAPAFQPTLPHRERRSTGKGAAFGQVFQPTLPHRERLLMCRISALVILFQPTLPHRERRVCDTIDVIAKQFQPTLPHRERHPGRTGGHHQNRFQPTLPHRERPKNYELTDILTNFNPRSRTGSDLHPKPGSLLHPYFNPRSRTGSDQPAAFPALSAVISTHAPAQGATVLMCRISALVILFQPTLPHRERRGAGLNRQFAVYISTHAPAQGATCCLTHHPMPTSPFQPTLPHRERPGSW